LLQCDPIIKTLDQPPLSFVDNKLKWVILYFKNPVKKEWNSSAPLLGLPRDSPPLPHSLYGRTFVRTVTSLPNFLGLMGYQFLLPMVLRWRASRAEALLLIVRRHVGRQYTDALTDSRLTHWPTRLPKWELGSNKTCPNGNWVLITRKTRWRSKVNFVDPYRSERFVSKTFQLSLGKVCSALQEFNKAQTSHRHATDALPTHYRRILDGFSLKSEQRVGRQLVDSRPTVGRLLTYCRPTVNQSVGRRVGRRVGGIGFFTFTIKE